MNFSKAKSLTIPEGNVTQIVDASGRVLWKSAPDAHDVVIAGGVQESMFGSNYKISVDGVENPCYPAFNLVTKSTASVKVTASAIMGKIFLNGETVLSGAGEYTLDLSDVTHVKLIVMTSALQITTYNISEQNDITVTVTGSSSAAAAHIAYNGVTYTSATTFTAKTGDLIYARAGAQIGFTEYYYVITSDMVVSLTSSSNTIGFVGITKIPEGHALVQITGNGMNNVYKACVLTIDGVAYASATTLVVPIGTVITCAIASMVNKEEPGYVKVNGTNVLSVPISSQGTYDYIVNGNVTINMSTVKNADKDRTGYITITEQ